MTAVARTKRIGYWIPRQSSIDAMRVAEDAARAEGFVVVTVAKITFEPLEGRPGWNVELVLRERVL